MLHCPYIVRLSSIYFDQPGFSQAKRLIIHNYFTLAHLIYMCHNKKEQKTITSYFNN